MPDFKLFENWFAHQSWKPFQFQTDTWQAYAEGKHGLLNAPTGSGKTYALWVPIIQEIIQNSNSPKGLQVVWITPLRALSQEIRQSAERLISDLDLNLSVGIRTGDTSQKERQRQKRQMPHLLITTPESLQLLLASKNYPKTFKNCRAVVVDEWHELLGTKRGVQMELALSRLKAVQQQMLRIWGISATIGNLEQARDVLLGLNASTQASSVLIKAQLHKTI
ncbi:MAG: DEAD/DEAH box helicase, partial [Psychroflexus salarius]